MTEETVFLWLIAAVVVIAILAARMFGKRTLKELFRRFMIPSRIRRKRDEERKQD